MAHRTDYGALQRLSGGQWEDARAARVNALVEALAATHAASRAIPDELDCGRVDLRRAAVELRSELRGQLTAANPFVASRAGAHTAADTVEELRRDCGYDPEGDSSVDALIAYKDALEDRLMP